MAEAMIHLLSYADDVAVIDEGSTEGIQRLDTRVNDILQGSKKDADMLLSKEKAKTLHVTTQDPITPTTATEAAEQCKFT